MKAVATALLLSLAGCFAQQSTRHPGCHPEDEACVFPVDGAEFLVGGLFDLRVEVHREMGRPDNHQGKEGFLWTRFRSSENAHCLADRVTFLYQ